MVDISGTEGQALYVDYSVGNTGKSIDRQDITLETDGTEVDRDTEILLDAGDATTGRLRWRTELGDEGTYTVSINSEDDTATIDVEIALPDVLIVEPTEVQTIESGATDTYSSAEVSGTLNVAGTLELMA